MRVIAITGGGAGLGRGIAWHFARLGYAVSITDRDAQAGRETLQVMREAGTKAVFVAGDVSKPSDVTRWLNQTRAKLGVPDVLINNAGIEIRKDVLKLSIAEFDRVIATNLRGTFLCSQGAARMMAKRRPALGQQRGAIINIASTRAFMSEPGTEGYTASKGGIVALTHGMAVSLARHRIRVNCISPGWILSKGPEPTAEEHAFHPAGRVGRVEDIASLAAFLAGPDSGFITGAEFVADGGVTRKMIYPE